jgi:hypothetical protein
LPLPDDRILNFATLNTYHVSVVARFLEKLRRMPDGDGTQQSCSASFAHSATIWIASATATRHSI